MGGRPVSYTIRHSNKALSAKVSVDIVDGVQVVLPKNHKDKWAEQILMEKADWVNTQIDTLSELAGCSVPRSFIEGEKLFYLGARYTLKLDLPGERIERPVEIQEDNIIVAVNPTWPKSEYGKNIRSTLINWYYEQAKKLISHRTNEYIKITGLKPAKIRVKEQKYRWGSCSGKGNLNFNWKLIMAPLHIIDYVIVHELCHLERMDHSSDFWQLVASLLPDYQKRRTWLKKYSPVLNL